MTTPRPLTLASLIATVSLTALTMTGSAQAQAPARPAPPAAAAGSAESRVLAPMNGRVLAVDVQNGDTVTKGQRLAVLEAMKMEHQLLARRDGVVDQVAVRAGDQVATRALLVSLVEQPD